MNIEVEKITFHRNGVSGCGFHNIFFKHANQNMFAVVFKEEGCVSVFNFDKLKSGDIDFPSNSYRGDCFEEALKAEILKISPDYND